MRAGAAALLFCGVLAVAAASAAQTPAAPPAGHAPREREVTFGAVFAAPSSMGLADAVLLGPNGTPGVTLFSTRNGMASGLGAELILGFRIGRRTIVEADGGVVGTSLKTDVSSDFEGASGQTISSPVVRWTLEGAVLWFFHERGKTGWFVRASGGVMGEASGDLSASETGFTGGGGVGVRHWWRTNGTGTFKRVGLRAEFRGTVQTGGLSLGGRTTRFVPTGAVHLVIGY